MSFKATLDLDGKPYKVKNVSFSLHQDVDFRNGKPASEVIPGSILSLIHISEPTRPY